MPYYLHAIGTDPLVDALGTFPAAKDAHTAKTAYGRELLPGIKLGITFIPTDAEAQTWRDRERRKLDEPGIKRLPWYREPWQAILNKLHCAYLSVEKPGLIAYTPSEEYGIADRQIRVRPGRYLEQFAAEATSGYFVHRASDDPFSGERFETSDAAQAEKTSRATTYGEHNVVVTFERDAHCARVKAIDDSNILRFARTADDIERVYRNGPGSCMSHNTSDYDSPVHPVRVYGDSDLAVAYMGDLEKRRIKARCVVWPSESIFTRIYGDQTLRYLLKQAGYAEGTLDGACVQVIPASTHDVYVMPYMDQADSAVLTTVTQNGVRTRMFTLRTEDSDDGPGRYSTRQTNGCTGDVERETFMCANGDCDAEVNDEDEYCQTCEAARFSCEHCHETVFDYNGDQTTHIVNVGCVCNGCERNLASICRDADCGDTFYEVSFTSAQRRYRAANDLTDYCLACQRTHETEDEESATV